MFQVHLGQFSNVLHSPTFCLSDHKWGTYSSAEIPTRGFEWGVLPITVMKKGLAVQKAKQPWKTNEDIMVYKPDSFNKSHAEKV